MSFKKYRNSPCVVGGIRFDSKKEASRYQDLLLLEQAGEIADLRRQVRYTFEHGGVKIASYTADFVYLDTRAQTTVVEDCKGFRTQVYKLKKKLLKAFYGIEVVET